MPSKKKSVAIVAKPSHTLPAIETGIRSLFSAFSDFLTAARDEDLPVALGFVRQTESLLDDCANIVKSRVKSLVLAKGERVTDAGTRRLTLNGYVLEVQPASTGYDPKKVEALLRSKGVDIASGMDAVVSYKVNEGKLAALIGAGKMSKDELETCRKDESWKVMSPKKEE